MLKFDISENEDLQVIDNTNDIFEGTRFAVHKFKIWYKKLSRTQLLAIEKKFTKTKRRGATEEQDIAKIENEKFVKQVAKWEGIHDVNGDAIECTDNNKKIIAEKMVGFSNLVLIGIVNNEIGVFGDAEEDENEDAEVKNSNNSGDGN